VNDFPRNNSWVFARDASNSAAPGKKGKDGKGNYWLMPHFSFWSWPLSFVGNVEEAVQRIDRLENGLLLDAEARRNGGKRGEADLLDLAREERLARLWGRKDNRAVWRGTTHFNPIGNKNLRGGLVRLAQGKPWADIEGLEWKGGMGEKADNALRIEDFCKYKYIIYTEVRRHSNPLHISISRRRAYSWT
jgi:hypothetical protein